MINCRLLSIIGSFAEFKLSVSLNGTGTFKVFLAQLDAVHVNESRQLSVFIHVQKLNKVFLAKALYNLPGIVFGSRQLYAGT